MNTQPKYPQSGLLGAMPDDPWCDSVAVDGDALPFSGCASGTIYHLLDRTNKLKTTYEKRKEDNLDDDWGPFTGTHCISETILYSDFTDGGSTSGTYTLKQTLPVGAYVIKTLVDNVTGFTGNVSATIIVGDGTDTDRYSTGTPSVFTTDTSIDMGEPSGTKWHDAAKSIIVTITSNSDFTLVTAGRLTIKILVFY